MSKKNKETNAFERENISSSSTSGINISNRLKIITKFFIFHNISRERERKINKKLYSIYKIRFLGLENKKTKFCSISFYIILKLLFLLLLLLLLF